MKTLEIFIKASLDSTRDSMGYSEDDDYDSDAVLYQQGYNMDVMEVEPDETFSIEEDYEGQVNCDETKYKFIALKDEWDDEPDDWEDHLEPGDPITLSPGSYKFLDDGITIQQLKKMEY